MLVINDERLTWEQIQEKYPNQNVWLSDIETEENSTCVKSAVIKYTSENTSSEELGIRSVLGEVMEVHTSKDKKDVHYTPQILVPTQFWI